MLVSTRKILFSAAATVAALGSTGAQAATANATAKANVLKPLQMTGGGTVDFGTIVTPSTASFSGTFTIDAAASQTSTYCASGFACTGTPAAAMFNLQGSNNANITLTVPLNVALTLQGATGTPPTLTFVTKHSLAANNGTGNYVIQLPNSGAPGLNFYVGGSVTIDQATAGGSYQGAFTVTADYQ